MNSALALAKTHIGTSGWHYSHWQGVFYPDDLKAADQLSFYAERFQTVEINNSFYRRPRVSTFENWKDAVPAGFLFAVKANRFITHLKKLNGVLQSTLDFIHLAGHLREKLGPILFQLPPSWKVNPARLEEFTDGLPQEYRFAFEFRNASWHVPEVYEILRRNNCAFCIYELAGHQSPMEETADFVYVRLHGPHGKYQGKYTDEVMADWAQRCRKWQQKGKEVYIYFDNDEKGYAAENARQLNTLLNKK